MSTFIKFFKGSKITDEDRASKVIQQHIKSENFKYATESGVAKDIKFLTIIYTGVYIRAYITSKFAKEEFDELLKIVEYNEDEIIKFLKYRTWNYRKLLNKEIIEKLEVANHTFSELKKLLQ